MLTIRPTSRFRKDVKRLRGGRYGKDLQSNLTEVLDLLVAAQELPPRFKDHALTGDYRNCRECHLKPDLLLVYLYAEGEVLELLRLGSHSELFG